MKDKIATVTKKTVRPTNGKTFRKTIMKINLSFLGLVIIKKTSFESIDQISKLKSLKKSRNKIIPLRTSTHFQPSSFGKKPLSTFDQLNKIDKKKHFKKTEI